MEPSSAPRAGPVGTQRYRPVRRDLGDSRHTPWPNTVARPGVNFRRWRVGGPRASALTPGRKAHGGAVAAANRTREIRPSGSIGGARGRNR